MSDFMLGGGLPPSEPRPCPPKCDMKNHSLTNSKHRHISAKRSVLWSSKYTKMRFQRRLWPGPGCGSHEVPKTSDPVIRREWEGDTYPHLVPSVPPNSRLRLLIWLRKLTQIFLCRTARCYGRHCECLSSHTVNANMSVTNWITGQQHYF